MPGHSQASFCLPACLVGCLASSSQGGGGGGGGGGAVRPASRSAPAQCQFHIPWGVIPPQNFIQRQLTQIQKPKRATYKIPSQSTMVTHYGSDPRPPKIRFFPPLPSPPTCSSSCSLFHECSRTRQFSLLCCALHCQAHSYTKEREKRKDAGRLLALRKRQQMPVLFLIQVKRKTK